MTLLTDAESAICVRAPEDNRGSHQAVGYLHRFQHVRKHVSGGTTLKSQYGTPVLTGEFAV